MSINELDFHKRGNPQVVYSKSSFNIGSPSVWQEAYFNFRDENEKFFLSISCFVTRISFFVSCASRQEREFLVFLFFNRGLQYENRDWYNSRKNFGKWNFSWPLECFFLLQKRILSSQILVNWYVYSSCKIRMKVSFIETRTRIFVYQFRVSTSPVTSNTASSRRSTTRWMKQH